MAINGSSTEILTPIRESLPSAQLLSNSVSSLHSTSARNPASQISKIYRQASTLFLTRRLPEALSTILPVISSSSTEHPEGNGEADNGPPVAKASRTTRIKVWSLYLTILNAVLELDPEEGKHAFGGQEWRTLCSKVRAGEVWEEVVKNGYGGVEGDVDADVVINLATLLLAHARTQQLNQQRLEAYLASSSAPNLDISNHFQRTTMSPRRRPSSRSSSRHAGADTPRDLNARVKILELYTLHVLLRNGEWDYAREFIGLSSILDEERREAFLQALQSLYEEHQANETREAEERERQEAQLEEDLREEKRRRLAEEEKYALMRQKQEEEERLAQSSSQSKRTSSEKDYGIDSPRSRPSSSSPKKSGHRHTDSSLSPLPHKAGPRAKGRPPPQGLIKRAGVVMANLYKLLENMGLSFKHNPMLLLRTLAFVVALVTILGRRDVQQRIKRMWDKVRATVGMGVKVSYI